MEHGVRQWEDHAPFPAAEARDLIEICLIRTTVQGVPRMRGEGVGGIMGYKEIQHMALFLVDHSD
jgi:hypothetical protein